MLKKSSEMEYCTFFDPVALHDEGGSYLGPCALRAIARTTRARSVGENEIPQRPSPRKGFVSQPTSSCYTIHQGTTPENHDAQGKKTPTAKGDPLQALCPARDKCSSWVPQLMRTRCYIVVTPRACFDRLTSLWKVCWYKKCQGRSVARLSSVRI